MRLIFSFCLILFSVPLFPQETGSRGISGELDSILKQLYTASHALLIGMADYTNGWPKLTGVKKDIEVVRNTLVSHGFHTIVVEDATRADLERALGIFISEYAQESQNRILIYFAGHGYTVTTSYGEELGYIVPVDAPDPNIDLVAFKNLAMPISQIEIFAKQIESKHALFVFDACFAGSIFSMPRSIPDIISYKTTLPVRQFITSGSANEEVPDESVFCQQFATALSTDEADMNGDGYLTGTELGEFLQSNVTNYTNNSQHPQYGKIRNPNLDKGDIIFLVDDEAVPVVIEDSHVPAIIRTNRYLEYPLTGVYIQWNFQYGKDAFATKISLIYNSKYLDNRYCLGLDLSMVTIDYAQSIETFPGLTMEDTTTYYFRSAGIYNRIYLFPQNRSAVNLFAGTSISWNNWQFEIGLRPFLTRRFLVELQSSYIIQKGNVTDRAFNYLGYSEGISKSMVFSRFYFGLNLQYFIRF